MKYFKKTVWVFLLLLASAAQAENNALEIVAQNQILTAGFESEEAEVKLTHQAVDGVVTAKTFDLKVLEEYGNHGEANLIAFKTPETIKGFSLLSQMPPSAEIESIQYIYFPALDSVKMITGASKTENFVNSAFSYEDLLPIRLTDYDFAYLRDEPCDAAVCAQIEAKSHSGSSAYSKKVIWFDRTNHQIRRVDFYDKAGKATKQCNLENYELFRNRFLRPQKITMKNLETREKSMLEFSSRRFGTALTADDFTPKAMKKEKTAMREGQK